MVTSPLKVAARPGLLPVPSRWLWERNRVVSVRGRHLESPSLNPEDSVHQADKPQCLAKGRNRHSPFGVGQWSKLAAPRRPLGSSVFNEGKRQKFKLQ